MLSARTDYAGRVAHLRALHDTRLDWRAFSVGDLAFTLEGLQVGLDDFVRVLRQADAAAPGHSPAALTDVCAGYRIGAVRLEEVSRFSGTPVGAYGVCAILVWPKTESDLRASSGDLRR